MRTKLAAWWRTRTAREQRLLLMGGALLAVVLGWLLIVRPLGNALAEAKMRHNDAVELLADTRSNAEALRKPEAVPPPPLGGALDVAVSAAASEAGFSITRLERQGSGVTLMLDAVRPPAFFGWLDRMERERGLVVERLSATANTDQTLAVQVVLRARSL